mgnify:CR=1 FL=1
MMSVALSLVLAVVLIQLMIPYYRYLTCKSLGFSLLDPQVCLFLVGALVITLLLAVLYPWFILSILTPTMTLQWVVVS